VEIAIGEPIGQDLIAAKYGSPKELMDFLRQQTYALSPKPMKTVGYGFEFEEKHREKRERDGRIY